MHNDFGCEDEEYVFEQGKGKAEACPVVSVLHNLQAVAIEIDIASKVHAVKGLQWNFVRSSILKLIGLVFECKVMLNRASWVFGFFISAGREGGCEVPVGNQNWDRGEETKEDGGLQASTEFP